MIIDRLNIYISAYW